MRRRGLSTRLLLALVVLLAIAGGVVVLTTGSAQRLQGAGASQGNGKFRAGLVFSPPTPAPPIALRNYLGKPVDLASYRGKAVLVTFLYTHCPDVCPLITADLHATLELLGPAQSRHVQIIVVSVDPRGDTPASVAAFLARHKMTGRMQYLIGSARELAAVWKAWGVGSERDVNQPEYVEHTGIVYGLSASGLRTTAYAANFTPGELAHDLPLLAAQ